MVNRYTLFILVLMAGIVMLQYDFWNSHTGYLNANHLKEKVDKMALENKHFQARNNQWYAEILSLRQDDFLLEGMARENLGYIKQGEVFYQIIPKQAHKISLQEDQ